MKTNRRKKRSKRAPSALGHIDSHLDPSKQLSAAFYYLHEARICFENLSKIRGVPPHFAPRSSEICELLDHLKRRINELQDEIRLNDPLQ